MCLLRDSGRKKLEELTHSLIWLVLWELETAIVCVRGSESPGHVARYSPPRRKRHQCCKLLSELHVRSLRCPAFCRVPPDVLPVRVADIGS